MGLHLTKITISLYFLFITFGNIHAQNFTTLSIDQRTTLLFKEKKLQHTIRHQQDSIFFFDKNGIQLYAFSDLQVQQFKSDLLKKPTKEVLTSQQPSQQIEKVGLKGVKIALDPGHMGGTFEMGQLEDKYIWIEDGQDLLRFTEGDLTFATANFLADSLRALGAEVLLTRNDWGCSSFEISFDDWFNDKRHEDLKAALAIKFINQSRYDLLNESEDKSLWFHKFFKHWDLRNRANLINNFQPDISIIIHYNVHVDNWKNRTDAGVFQKGVDNYHMAFVPGSFMRGELNKEEDLFNLIRMTLSDQLDKSIALSSSIMEGFNQLGPVNVPEPNQISYLNRGCIPTNKAGVYARNLSLTRLINSPLCYGESLCQDNLMEARMLTQKELPLRGKYVSKRTYEVAMAYLYGIKKYYH